MKLGKLGVWAAMDALTAAEGAAFAKRVEAWGYAALWLPESRGRNVLVHSSWLLANTTRLIVAPGIANIYARDPMAMVGAQMALAEQSGGRFLLGMGVSHAPLVEGVRGQVFENPVKKLRAYLEAMATAPYIAARPAEKPLTLVAALGPQMLRLVRELADGSHPYNVTPEHTAQAREILGPGKLICTEQMVLLETDPAAARAAGRKVLATYLPLPNYRNNLMRLGFAGDDFENGGSDRLIDGVIAWGDEAAIRRRVQQHWDAGADHVCIQAVPADGNYQSPIPTKILELMAPTAG